MKVCDKHPAVKAVDTLVYVRDDEHVDVCAQCLEDVRQVLREDPVAPPSIEPPPKRRGRPPKTIAVQ